MVCAFIALWFIFGGQNNGYSEYVIHSSETNNDVLFETYYEDAWRAIRISIHISDSSSAWTPVLVYHEAYKSGNEPWMSWNKYIEPNVTWLNSKELKISVNEISQIIYKKNEVGCKKIVFSIGKSACQEMSNKSLLYGLRGAYWTNFVPDGQCMDLIEIMFNARYDVRQGKDKAEVWKMLQEHGVTDEDIWRIGL